MSKSKNTISYNAKAAEAKAAARVRADLKVRISDLANRREAWEVNEYDRSNQCLYGLIAECLALYLDLTTGDDLKSKKQGLSEYIKAQGYVFKEASPLSLKVIRCVFGSKDRRRLSTYHTVLLAAIESKWAVAEVAMRISECGGVQEISLNKAGGMTTAEKAEVARAAVMSENVGTIDSDTLRRQFNTEHRGEQAVAVLTINDDGTYSVHCVVRSDSAVNAALAAYFAANKKQLQVAAEQQKLLSADAEKAQLTAEAAKAANDAQSKKAA